MSEYKLFKINKNEDNKYTVTMPLYEHEDYIYTLDDLKKKLEERTKKQTLGEFDSEDEAKEFIDEYNKDIVDFDNFKRLLDKLNDYEEQEIFKLVTNVSFNKKDHYEFTTYKIPYYHCDIKNRYIQAGFCTTNEDSYHYINGKIAIDFVREFDKWSKCPFYLPLPQNEEELELLLNGIFWCFYTEEGWQSYKREEWTYCGAEKTITSYDQLQEVLKKYSSDDKEEETKS